MVNWKSPQTIEQDSLATIKVAHFIIGVYMWDWAMGLPSEYRLITRKHEWKSGLTISVYIGCRVFAFADIISTLVFFNHSITRVNCNVLTRLVIAFSYAGLVLSSVIIGLRAIAIWRRHKVAIVATISLLATSVAFLIRGVILGPRVYWDPASQSCGIQLDTVTVGPTIEASFAVDFALIIMMLVGLWVYKGSGSIWQLLYQQGIIWAIAALLCYLPSVVLVLLNLNAPMNLITETPTAISMILCTTTMQRRLFQYSLSTTNPQVLPRAVMRRSVRYDGRRPEPAADSSPTDSHVTMPRPTFIETDKATGSVLDICNPYDDDTEKHASTIV